MKSAFQDFLKAQGDEEIKLNGLEDEKVKAFMVEDHPRFYALCGRYGSPLESVKVDSDLQKVEPLLPAQRKAIEA